jgi:DNA primase
MSRPEVNVPGLLDALGIKYRRQGHELQALCPFHNDSKPSWSIRDQLGSPRHGRHHCFSCGQGGGVLALIEWVHGLTRDEARDWAARFGIFEQADLEASVELEVVGEPAPPFVMPREVIFKPFSEWVTPAKIYAISRGITEDQVERWGIGYAVYGRLGGRIVLPIWDEAGRLASYTGRAFDGDELRYLHPKREENPREGAIYGSHLWKGWRERVVINEGELNALACERAGEAAVGALSGVNVTPDVIALLSSFDVVIVLTDPDAAGDTAAMKVFNSLTRWRRVVRIRLPAGYDAAKLDPEDLRAILSKVR